ncbi:SR34, partial [Symbiodinium microadriaticum]
MTERDLEDVFSKYGKVTEARLAVDRDSNRPKGFAFVTMEDARDAKDAVDGLVDYEFEGRAMTAAEELVLMCVTTGRRDVATAAVPAGLATLRMAVEAVDATEILAGRETGAETTTATTGTVTMVGTVTMAGTVTTAGIGTTGETVVGAR